MWFFFNVVLNNRELITFTGPIFCSFEINHGDGTVTVLYHLYLALTKVAHLKRHLLRCQQWVENCS